MTTTDPHAPNAAPAAETRGVKPLPKHVAVIMDGNGRWAKQRGLSRSAGHQKGVEAVNKITEEAVRMGLKFLTLYTFSMENWHRPTEEVEALMTLLIDSLNEEIFMKNNVRLRTIGDSNLLSPEVAAAIRCCEERTAGNNAMTVVLAISYSARWELTEAARALARQVESGNLRPDDITEERLAGQLRTAFMPDPDLLIRTGGEQRLSNFLMWQNAYSELYFTPTYWPDFSPEEFRQAIHAYQHRERRYGMTSEQLTPEA